MWLVPQRTTGTKSRIDVPEHVLAALVRWYCGTGTDRDHAFSVALVREARDRHLWFACRCRGDDKPPLLTPSLISQVETFYLKRLTSQKKKRPLHAIDCPFYREMAPPRNREKASAFAREIPTLEGYFYALNEAPEKLAKMPEESEPDDRTRQVAIPKLAKMLWMLMDRANFPKSFMRTPDQDIKQCMERLRHAAEGLYIAPRVPLTRHLHTFALPLHTFRIHAQLRAAEEKWPDGYAPQAFMLIYSVAVKGNIIQPAGGQGEIELDTRVVHPTKRLSLVGGPFLSLIVVGKKSSRSGYLPLRGFTQPILNAKTMLPVMSFADRRIAEQLDTLAKDYKKRGIHLAYERPLFDIPGQDATFRPDFIIEFIDANTGEVNDVALYVDDGDDNKRLQAMEYAKQRNVHLITTPAEELDIMDELEPWLPDID